jgi:hypothetical protein
MALPNASSFISLLNLQYAPRLDAGIATTCGILRRHQRLHHDLWAWVILYYIDRLAQILMYPRKLRPVSKEVLISVEPRSVSRRA